MAGGEGVVIRTFWSVEFLKSAQIFDPGTDSWTTTGPMSNAHTRHISTTLADGRILVAGGQSSETPTNNPQGTNSTEVYDESSGSWSPVAPMSIPRSDFASTVLSNGQVLVTGGIGPSFISYSDYFIGAAEVFDPKVPEIELDQPPGTDIPSNDSRNFGDLVLGTESQLQFTIRNAGTDNLTGLNIMIDGADPASFGVTESLSATTVEPGASGTFTIRFSPDSEGFKTAILHVASNDGDENPYDIRLAGSAYIPASEIEVEQPVDNNLVAGQTTRNFGRLAVCDLTSLQFTVRNVGTAELTDFNVTIDGANPSGFSIIAPPSASKLAVGESTEFEVSFSPISAGVQSATLHISSNDSDESDFEINLTGSAFSPAPEIAVEQPAGSGLFDGKAKASFGTAKVGGKGVAKVFTIRNKGTANLKGLAIKMDGDHKKDFTLGVMGKATLAPGASTNFKVTFEPVAKGTHNAAIHIQSNDANESPFDIKLTGLGADR